MRLIALCASLGLAATSFAQNPGEPGEAFRSKSLFLDFQQQNPGPWMVQWNAATVTPSAIYGNGLPLTDWRENSLEEARRHAHLVLAQYHDLLGLGSSDFREEIGARMGRTWSFVFNQYFQGLPVIGGRADVRINMRGVVAMMGSRAWPIPANFSIVPVIGEQAAMAAAWARIDGPLSTAKQPAPVAAPRLVIWGDVNSADTAPFQLAWEVAVSNVDANGAGQIGRFYVDANNGEVLHYTSDKHECGIPGCVTKAHVGPVIASQPVAPVPTLVTVMAWTRTGVDGQSALVNVPLPGLELSVPGVGTVVTDQNGQFTVDIAAAVNVTVGALNGRHHAPILGANAPSGTFAVSPGVNSTIQLLTAAATTNEGAHTTTSYWVDATNEWARSILGTSSAVLSAMNTISGITPTVNIASTCNAYYTGNTINFYQAGGGCANTAFSTVVSHEWGHGLDERFGGISNNNGDGLSEGWGDIIGMYLVDNPNLGQGFQTAGVALRSGNNTKLYGSQTEVHAAGEIWMGFAWKFRENLRAAFGTLAALQISNDAVIGSIVANATNQADAVREVFIADDDDGILANGTPHYTQLQAAAITKGMPYPAIQVAYVSHTPLTDTTARLTPRMVFCTAAAVSTGNITGVNLVYNAGGGSLTRAMVPTGQPDGFRALLPGKSSGAVSYHIEAVHSGGTTVRLPATGEYTYVVTAAASGPFAGFYTENFDTGAAGWTHGRYSTIGTDDWQLGAPAGKSGTVTGVTWADPATAVSGTGVYGTDLGQGTSNGRYPNSIDYYLRSPVLNCTGRQGVTLRFKRWLSCEEGIYDQARIFVNGVEVWANPANAHVQDTAWQTVQYAIPAADNNSAVQIEFRLTTDVALNLGGWQIDDFEVGEVPVAPLDATLTMLPEQIQQGGTVTLAIHTTLPGAPVILAIGDTAGPTLVAPLPPVLVGGPTLVAYFAGTDATGDLVATFAAPPVASAVGTLWFSQVVTINPTLTAFITSNQFLNLFTL